MLTRLTQNEVPYRTLLREGLRQVLFAIANNAAHKFDQSQPIDVWIEAARKALGE